MISQLSHIMTLANSIIGVSVLAMPFCFKQCGIILAIVVLILSSTLSRLACHFLIKSAVMSRRRNFELLAFHAFGHMGKFLVELFIIGFLVGTCIAFFVVMGDLGPQIVRKVIDKSPEDIRTSLLITTSIFIVLPLGLLRNIDSLSTLCTATIIFYLCLVLKIITESMQHIFAGDWYEHVYYWRPSGILQCVPIFSMALFCQTQLFEIYETIPNVSLEKMNEVVRGALNICTIVYLCVGFFGYIAFCTQPFTGNILMSFEPTLSSEMIKMGFVFSIAFSFPLVIFPCRASLNSLLFRRVYSHEPSINYLPETRFRCLTIIIVVVSLITGILIPNIEFVLGLVGSTIGVMICLIFPAIFFISISNKHTNERLLAQVILFIGICIMILSTYANLYALEESANTKILTTTNKPLNQINNLPLNLNKDDINAVANVPNNPNIEIPPNIKEKGGQLPSLNVLDKSLNLQANDIRQEPPIPVERIVVTDKPMMETQNPVDTILVTFAPVIKKMVEEIKTMDTNFHKQSNILVKDNVITQTEFVTGNREESNPIIMKENNPSEMKDSFINAKGHDNSINSDAIKKEESELAAYAEAANVLVSERHEKLRKTLEKHKQEQLQMMEEQKEILKDLKEQKQEIERQKQKIIKDTQEHQKYKGKLNAIYKNGKSVTQSNKNITVMSSSNEKVLPKKQKSINDKSSNAVFSNNENLNKEQNVQIDKNHMLFHNKVHIERIKKVGASSNDTKELPKGPILNALTKRVLQRSISINGFKLNDSEPDKIMYNNKNTDTDIIFNSVKKPNLKIGKIQHEYSLPIALKMRNQTSIENTLILIENKSEESVQIIHRDILENHEREKREINMKIEETSTKVISDISSEKPEYLIKNFSIKNNREKCFKQNEQTVENSVNKLKKKINQNLSKSDIVETPLIRTNVYLSEQGFENAVSMDSNIPIRGEYVKLKQRDLKFVNTAEDYI
ncbi:Putative sodium-coupled neutral amino acid transporter 10 [Eufriesea mexicana]|uniref:putative sodium-coupled neutral amino acid transporter 10 n=1 Tax=Eufriesea mexicana TaxID=516756 RepID=UPI00083BCCCC|nr:PREDICTED: putative sodium-coupled neutral amino acid transporter 10 [Eufriesea mexicana]OAD57261.1 Putative sodium-coupled neutral amino acid transporter 10 [Eufriesea mexicana]